jgi:hypothetical protein
MEIQSRQDFNVAAKALVILGLQAVDNDVNITRTFDLGFWELEGPNESPSGSYLYLVHPPIITNHPRCDNITAGSQHSDDVEDVGEEPSLEDDSVLVDPDSCHQALPVDESSSLTTIDRPIQLWNFSVVYSDTFQVPVLYFHVQHSNGEPCSRSQVLTWLKKPDIEDSWEFLSQEEHPCTRLPSFFLHPCQTPELLRVMMMTTTTTPDQGGDGGGSHALWAWLSLILGAVGYPIPADFYLHVQKQLQNATNTNP